MVSVEFTKEFKIIFFKIKDNLLKKKLINQIKKLKLNPKSGKPMMNVRKGTRELYIKPLRLSYLFLQKENKIYILDLYHKKRQ